MLLIWPSAVLHAYMSVHLEQQRCQFLQATCNERCSVSYMFAAVNFHSLRLCTLNSTFVLLQTFKQHEIDQVLTSLNMTKSVIVVSIRQYILVRKTRDFTDLTTIMYLIWGNACSGPSAHELHQGADLLLRNCSAFFFFPWNACCVSSSCSHSIFSIRILRIEDVGTPRVQTVSEWVKPVHINECLMCSQIVKNNCVRWELSFFIKSISYVCCNNKSFWEGQAVSWYALS